jgi:hypothetical protein
MDLRRRMQRGLRFEKDVLPHAERGAECARAPIDPRPRLHAEIECKVVVFRPRCAASEPDPSFVRHALAEHQHAILERVARPPRGEVDCELLHFAQLSVHPRRPGSCDRCVSMPRVRLRRTAPEKQKAENDRQSRAVHPQEVVLEERSARSVISWERFGLDADGTRSAFERRGGTAFPRFSLLPWEPVKFRKV